MTSYRIASILWLGFSFTVGDVFVAGLAAADETILVGAARVDITPTHPVVLAGYGSRTIEHEGVDRRIFARALALGGEGGALVIAVENCGVPASVTARVKERLHAAGQVLPEHITVCATHTHSAPNLEGYATILWAGRTNAEEEARMRRYTNWLVDRMVEVGTSALKGRRPARLAWGQGRLQFGGNRRVLNGGKWAGFGFNKRGPVDHSLPLLVARGNKGQIVAVWSSYACHCTTPGARNRIGGDWAGYASDVVEARHQGAVALTTIGCGADIGPVPSGGLAEAEAHGKALANEIDRLLRGPLTPLVAVPQVQHRAVALPLAKLPSRSFFEGRTRGFEGEHARAMLKILDREGKLPTHVSLPVSTWTFDDDLAILFLGGEVVVDYAVRLKRELDWRRLWINAWADDVPCYIPSRRVLREGGYEADFSMIYYAQPTRFAPEVEDVLAGAVVDLLKSRFAAPAGNTASPFHVHPAGDVKALGKAPALTKGEREAIRARVDAVVRQLADGKRSALLREFAAAQKGAVEGFAQLIATDGGEDMWFDYTGRKRPRPFVRQKKVGDALRWKTPRLEGAGKTVTLAFLGGVGWKSQPTTEGFTLMAGDSELLQFDVTLEPARWTGENGSRLLFFPTWTSSEDACGFFFLTLPAKGLQRGEALQLAVRSRGKGSLRWFAVDWYTGSVKIAAETLGEHLRGR